MSHVKGIALKPTEQIVAVIRRFPIVDLPHYIGAALCVLVIFFFFVPLMRLGTGGILGGGIVLLCGFALFFRTIFLWYHNLFIITTERIIDFDQRGFFERVVSQSSFEKIQDISVHTHGALQTMFRYGDINLKTGWGSVDLCVPSVYRPHRIQRLLIETQDEFLATQRPTV